MRKVKVGDKIVVTKFDGKEIEPTIRSVIEIDEDKALMLMDEPIDESQVIEHDDWIWNDDWRFAVRKGDRLIVTRICGENVDPTEVIAQENEWEVGDGLISIDKQILPNDFLSDILDLQQCEYDDEWRFAEQPFETTDYLDESEEEITKGVCGDICDSYNGVVAKDDVETDTYTPQSYADFNASTGGGKTLKDYTGVEITKESLGFTRNSDKVIEGITPDSLAFEPKEDEEVVGMVNHPPHYNRYEREVIDSIRGLCTPEEFRGYLKGNVIKYIARYQDKGGEEDIEKSGFYNEELRKFVAEMDAKEVE